MRDIVLFALIFGSLPYILKRPWVGIIMWSFVSYMNPHRLTWGPAFGFPFAAVVAVTLLMSLIFTKEKIRLEVTPIIVLWLMFIAWMCVTTSAAFFPDGAVTQLKKVFKIQLVTFLTMVLITNRFRLNVLIATICASIGFFGIKGGVFVIRTAGSARVWGPPGSYISENNTLAVALLMIIPLGIYLARLVPKRWQRLGIYGGVVLCFFSVFGSQSRGALLATLAMSAFLVFKSKQKVLAGLAMIAVIPLIISFMPQSWHDRMATIQEYEQDGSAMGRLNAWRYAINLANDRITGGGFESWSQMTFARYAPVPDDVHAAHSIYFSVLADHGWIGLIMYLGIYASAWLQITFVAARAKRHPELRWMEDLGRMLKVSLVAYLVGGAFLSLSYFDLPWHLVAISCIMAAIQKRHFAEAARAARVAHA